MTDSDGSGIVVVDGPFSASGRLFVLYDADCPFCRWAVRRVLRWSRGRGRARLSASTHLPGLGGPTPVPVALGLASRHVSSRVRAAARQLDLSRELTVLDEPTGRVARGGDAILTLVDTLPGGQILRPWWSDRPFVGVIRLGYHVVAARRSRLADLGFDAPGDPASRSHGIVDLDAGVASMRSELADRP